MDKYRKLFSNTVFLLLGNFGSKILSFFMVKYYTSVYTTSEYGILDLISTTAGFAVPLITLGINEAVFRFSIDDENNRFRIYSSSLLIALIGNIILAIFCMFFKGNADILNYKKYLLLFCLTDSIYVLTATFCRGIQRTALYAWSGIFHSVIQIVVAVVSISVLNQGVGGYFIAFAVANLLSCFLIWSRLRILRTDYKQFSVDNHLLKQMLIYSIPLIVNTCCWWIMASLDKYVIAVQLGSDANGLYAAASKIPAVITTISTILFQAWQISSVTEMNSADKGMFYSEIHDLIYIIIALFSSFVLLLLKPIHSFLVGKDFLQAWVYTPFLIIAMNFSCLASFYGSNYVAMKKTNGALWTSLIAAIVNVILNIILTSKFGMFGTAFATMLSYLILWIIRMFSTSSFVVINTNYFKVFITYIVLFAQSVAISKGHYSILFESAFFLLLLIIHYKKLFRIYVKFKMMLIHRIG